MGGMRDPGPSGGLLGDHERARKRGVDGVVEFLEKPYGFQILPPSVLVRYPLTLLARVVQVEHGGDRINAEAVDMVLVQPEEGVPYEKVPDLVPRVVEDEGSPIGMLPLSGIGVIVEVRAVEQGR